MKKLALLLLSGLFILTSCVVPKKEANESSSSASSSKTTASSSTETSSSSEAEDNTEKTRVFTYQQEVSGLTQNMTITTTYKGSEFIRVKIDILQPFDDETLSILKQQDINTVRQNAIPAMEQAPEFTALKNIEGVDVKVDISDNYEFLCTLDIDMATVDLEAASQEPTYGDMFEALKDVTPSEYFLGLSLIGAEEVTTP